MENEIIKACSLIDNLQTSFNKNVSLDIFDDEKLWDKFDIQCSQNVCKFISLLIPSERQKFLKWGASILEKNVPQKQNIPEYSGVKKDFSPKPPVVTAELPSIDMRRLRGCSIKDLSEVCKNLHEIRAGIPQKKEEKPASLPPPPPQNFNELRFVGRFQRAMQLQENMHNALGDKSKAVQLNSSMRHANTTPPSIAIPVPQVTQRISNGRRPVPCAPIIKYTKPVPPPPTPPPPAFKIPSYANLQEPPPRPSQFAGLAIHK